MAHRLALSCVLAIGCSGPAPGEDGSIRCTEDAQCDDGLFCNGTERCAARAPGAGPDGCAPAEAPPCDRACSEETDACVDECPDSDGDGHDETSCGGDDCADADPDRFPGNPEVCDAVAHDEDCNPATYGPLDADEDGADSDACCNGSSCGTDCDDTDPGAHPGEAETCDGIDNDCDGAIDDGALETFYRDADGDDFGDPSDTQMACVRPVQTADVAGDCDDSDPSVYMGAREECDGEDDDCDTRIDEGAAGTYYADGDGDGYGDDGDALTACSRPSGYATRGGDCDDDSPARNPGVVEICNGTDDDCDGRLEAPGEDADGDGQGGPGCGGGRDCDDGDPDVYRGAPELCDGRDNDCDPATVPSDDRDGDGHLPAGASCAGGPLASAPRDDCDEDDPSRHGGMVESCNLADDDCDGAVDGPLATAWCNEPGRSPNAIATCEGGSCALACDAFFHDCDESAPGCESDERAPSSCGACGNVCEPGAICASGRCSPELAWDTTMSASIGGVIADATGCQVVGSFVFRLILGSMRFDGIDGTEIIHAAYDAEGDLRWAHPRMTAGTDDAYAAALASSGDVLLAGRIGVTSPPGGTAALVEPRSPAGVSRGQRTFGAGTATAARFIATLPGGGYVVLGTFRDTITLGSVSYSSSAEAPFLAAFDAGGVLDWSRALPALTLHGLGVDGAGNVYVALSGVGPVDLGGGNVMASSTSPALALASYSGDTGAHRWSRFETRNASGTVDPYGTLLAVRASGPCWIADARGIVDLGGHVFSADGTDSGPLLACFDALGAHATHRELPSRNVIGATASGEELVLSGYVYDEAGTDLGTGPLPPGGFIARHGADLAARWAWSLPSSGIERISVGPGGRICAAGFGEVIALEE